MRKLISALIGSAVVIAGPVQVHAAPLPDAIPAEVFAAPPTMVSPRLSPNGDKIASKVLVNGKQSLVVTSVDTAGVAVLAAGDLDVNWWKWVTNDWLVIGLGDTVNVLQQDAYITRVAGVSADLTKFIPIDWARSGQFADDVIFVARDGSTKILLSKQTGFTKEVQFDHSVFEADVATGRVKQILGARGGVNDWYADSNGVVRHGYAYDELVRRGVILYRPGDGQEFKKLPSEGLPHPLIYRADGSAIGVSDKGGFDELYEISLPAFTLGRKLYAAPGYDVEGVYPSSAGDQLSGVSYIANAERVEWIDPALKDVQRQIDRATGAGNGRIVSWNRNRDRILVEVGGANQAGGTFFWDVRAGSPRLIGWKSVQLKDRKLSPVKSIRYKARDGTQIEAVLTLPRGRDPKNLPLIVLPHGGPAARDKEEFDWWTQYLAEIGYAVIQPNYRGSTGYGAAFRELGEGQFGLKMQDDLIDAISWAAGQGIADSKRVCIAGASYGGYAAMRGAQRDGSHYRCAISFAGVSDLKEIVRYDRQYLIGNNPKKYWRAMAPDFAAVSPRYHAAEFSVPILIVHGARDKRVPVKQSRMMVAALQRAGKGHTYIEQKQGDHYFSRTEDRIEFLKAMKAFLDKHNPA